MICAAGRGSSGGIVKKGRFASVSSADGERAAAAGFNSRTVHIISASRELIIPEENGTNDWLMERHLAARKDGHK